MAQPTESKEKLINELSSDFSYILITFGGWVEIRETGDTEQEATLRGEPEAESWTQKTSDFNADFWI